MIIASSTELLPISTSTPPYKTDKLHFYNTHKLTLIIIATTAKLTGEWEYYHLNVTDGRNTIKQRLKVEEM